MNIIRPAVAAALAVLAGIFFATYRNEAPANKRILRVWCNQGQEAENQAMRRIAADFNAANAGVGVEVLLSFFPDFQYTEKLSIAAASEDLPDCFNFDGPLATRFVDAGLLRPLDSWMTDRDRADFLPSILQQGTIHGHLYAIGAFDSALVLYYDRGMVAQAGVQIPPAERGWTWDEFLRACGQLKSAGFEPLALHMNESSDEWFTYAFSPVIWSGGGSLISKDGFSVKGVLASPENVRSLRAWQQLFIREFSASDPIEPNPFDRGKVAMDWNVHGLARSHVAVKGQKLGVMPLPRTGSAAYTPCGSWCWGISARTANIADAFLWLKWMTDPDHGIEPIVRANGAVPARRSALAAFPEYSHLPYSLFLHQSETTARPRPHTPYYAALTRGFASALRDIAHGAEVQSRLRMAEDEIQSVIDRRPPPSP